MPRARRSAADLSVVRIPGSRPEPPPELDAVEARHWREMVGSMPSAWLSGAAPFLLARYASWRLRVSGWTASYAITPSMPDC
jgi:hypothetical protein